MAASSGSLAAGGAEGGRECRGGRIAGAVLAALAVSAASAAAAGEERRLNVYGWFDALPPATLANFEKETGIRVAHETYDANETLDARLRAGASGFDVVFPSYFFMERQIADGLYRRLDKSKLGNLRHLDAGIAAVLADSDPGNAHAVPDMWGMTGMGFDEGRVRERMAEVPTDSYDLIFKPEIVSRFADCGVFLLVAPREVVALALNYLGLDPNGGDMDDLRAAMELLEAVRPYVRYFSGRRHVDDLARGEVCLGILWSPDVPLAQARADEAGRGVRLAWSVPREGALLWIDSAVIPADARHPGNAHRFIDYLLRPDVAADRMRRIPAALPNAAAAALLDAKTRSDRATFPTDEERSRLFRAEAHGPAYARALAAAWAELRKDPAAR